MKINLNKTLSLLVMSLIVLIGFNSCVKDRNVLQIDYSKIDPIIELIANPGTTGGQQGGVSIISFTPVNVPQEIRLYVNYAYSETAPRDITITLAKYPTGLSDYNTANAAAGNPTNFTFAPDSVYNVPTYKAVIKKGERLGYISIFINPSKVSLTAQFGVAFQIVDADGFKISQNAQNITYPILVKNQYDADYAATGWVFHPTAGRAIGAIYHLSTVTATTTKAPVADLGASGYYFNFDVSSTNTLINFAPSSGSALPGPGGAAGSSGFMTADNPGGTSYADPTNAGHVPGDALFNSTIYNNTYNPTTKTFFMHFGYVAGVTGGQNTYTRQFYMKLVRQ